jgi:hypothetical protein
MRQAAFSHSLVLVALAACGGSNDKSANVDAPSGGSTDAPGPIDAPGGGGNTITITGTAVERMASGMVAVSGATIAAYQNGNDATPVVMTTSMANGDFSLAIPAAGGPLDGYLKATKTGLKDTYLYPPAPISADTVAPVNMISPGTLNLLVILAIGAGNQQAGKGLIALVVVNGATATSTPVAGAAVTSTPAASATIYNGSNGLPDTTANGTGADGTAFLFNVASDANVTVNATKTGSTFTSHSVKAWPDQFTTTLITPAP